MAFSTEFVMGAGGGGVEPSIHLLSQSPAPSAQVGDTITAESDGAHSLFAIGWYTGNPNANAVFLSVRINGEEVERSGNNHSEYDGSILLAWLGHLNEGDEVQVWLSGSTFGGLMLRNLSVGMAPVQGVLNVGTSQNGSGLKMARLEEVVIFEYTPARSGMAFMAADVVYPSSTTVILDIREDGTSVGSRVPISKGGSNYWEGIVNLKAGVVFSIVASSTSYSTGQREITSWNISLL